MNIEDTIFNDTLPVNPIPVVDRLLELIKEADTNVPAELLEDERIQRVLYLLTHQFQMAPKIVLGSRVFNKYGWYGKLHETWRKSQSENENL